MKTQQDLKALKALIRTSLAKERKLLALFKERKLLVLLKERRLLVLLEDDQVCGLVLYSSNYVTLLSCRILMLLNLSICRKVNICCNFILFLTGTSRPMHMEPTDVASF